MMQKHNTKKWLGAVSGLLLTAVCAFTTPLQAQDPKYTLTAGSGTGTPADRTFEVLYNRTTANPDSTAAGYCEVNGSWRLWIPLVNPVDTAYNARKGSHYLRLNIAGEGSIEDAATFDKYCVWSRSDSMTGYYYQEHDNYRYYLKGSSSLGGTGLQVVKVQVGQPISGISEWYDWDLGAALDEPYEVNGAKKSNYFWLSWDPVNSRWSLSLPWSSYERPDTKTYLNGDQTGASWRYYCYQDANPTQMSYHGALFLPVQYVSHGKEIQHGNENLSLTAVALTETGSATAKTTLKYGESLKATPTIAASVNVPVIPAYDEYFEEVSRRGFNLSYKQRKTPGLGYAGVPTIEKHIYWASDPTVDQGNTLPTATTEALTIDGDNSRITYSLDNRSRRYLSISKEDANAFATVSCISMPATTLIATLTVTVEFTNGTSEQMTVNITVSPEVPPVVNNPVNAPVVRGGVFGGGRMADVTGNTAVTVHNCDTIAYVYGGNDISGRVQGSDGSLVTLGSASSTTGVFIGSVYGGGNGYYNYQYQQGTTNDFVEGASQGTQFKGNVWQWGGTSELVMENMADGSYIPGITHTKVVMNSDLVKVDTLFGGARNAFLTGYDASDNVAAIEYNHGVAYAVFGGNNVGGSLTTGKKVSITVNNTKLPTSEATERDESVNTYFAGFGRHFGIRYLFGGGNMVNVPLVNMSILGGRIDTCFAGGNSATVEGTTVEVNCPSATTKKFTNTTSGSNWVGGKHRYNVRCLFGGNNLATMAVMPTLTLTSGGIGTVYGGGNQGAMTAAVTPASAVTTDFTEARIINPPTKLSTTVLVNSDDMEIDYLYGGCRLANVTNSTYVKVTDGTIGTLFGGSNIGGRIGAEDDETEGTFVVMAGGTVKTNVFAGSNGYYHCNVNGKYTLTTSFSDADGELFDYYDDYAGLDIPTHQNTNLLILGGTVNGNAYGGANLTNVGYSSTRNGTVHLTMDGGTVNGNVFGGGNMASIYGLSYLFVTGNSVIDGGLYAGNDRVGRIETFSAKYKMKNAGAWVTDGAFTATDNTTQLNEYVDGKWQAAYSSYVRIEGSPHIHHVYGSGNGAYNYDGDYPQYGEPLVYCDLGGGNNRPIQSSSFIDLHPSNTNASGIIDTVFGGGNGVSVRDEVVVLLNAENTADRYVGTIFGGNNRDVMAMANNVPEVRLLKGKVGDVYGGGNAGAMQNTINLTDRCGNDVFGVSTHVKVESSDAIVEGDLYGGCRMADVKGMAYVEVYNTHDGGINTIYGGNNVSGRINGNTRVDISGGKVGTIYGGSNGYYDYVEIAANNYNVYDLGYSNNPAHLVATGASGSPKVSRTLVNVFGGTITDNVYGGGRLGDCDTTEVVVNDTVCSNGWGGATIDGTIFGGGEGLWNNLSLPRRGNVDTVCYVHLYHATSVGSGLGEVKAYGGGRGGDVWNTYINVYPYWEQPFDAIYGGCWGSDVAGTTHVTMDGQLKEGARNATDVYGGNDFTGSVYKSIVTINSGRYTNVYGGGNGYYDGDLYVESNANHNYSTPANRLYVPNNEFAEVNFIDGHVENNIYGGGKMGTTFRYLRGGNGDYALDGNGRKQADTSSTTGYADINNYSIVEVNVHGGHISGNVYAGGAGDDKQLVYGVKVLNMEDGIVDESVYGGSENVDDGYRKECVDANTTTLRPSSIVNVTGGHITSHVFGGGYRGKVYGSTYVNLGVEAVENSTVWTSTIRGTANAYAGLKPTLTAHQLVLVASVYGGANWGTNVGSEDFTVEGFAGGENRIRIDGLGYNTSQTESVLPVFSIANSVIGSGTSAKGGDVLSRIDILNYGHKSEFCDATRQLMSVQRAHQLWLNNTAIEYIGATDARSAYTSVNYTINHIDSVNARGFNLIELDAPMDNIKSITFWEQELDGSGNLVKVTKKAMNDVVDGHSHCDGVAPVSICEKLESISPDAPVPPALEQRHTALLINSGKNINIMYKEGNPAVTKYGAVYGFAYLVAPSGKNATVVAKYKIPGTANDNNDGFVSTCEDLNKQYSDGSWVTGDANTIEYPYTNYGTTYRTWSLNKGIRSRQGVILANGTPSSTPDVNKGLVVTANEGGNPDAYTPDHMVLALSTIDLPQTSPGHYYALTTESFVLTGDNEDLNLVDSAWYPDVAWSNLPGNYQWETSNAGMGHWETAANFTGVKNIKQSPANTFGLIVAAGDNFSTTMPAGHTSALPYTVISGTPRVNQTSNFCTPKVKDGDDQVTPKLNLFLTYENSFSHTFIGSVRFTLKEYDETGQDIGSDIEMEVIVSTVIRDFKPISCEVLAMNNEGRTNTFLRKTVLPATMQKRELYLTYVRWLPTNDNGEDRDPATVDNFHVAKDEATVLAESYTPGVPPTRFGLTVYPTDDVSSTLSSSIGWHSIAPDSRAINVWDLARKNDATPYNEISKSSTDANYPYADTVTQRVAGINKGRGKLVGVLDGRGLAALNVELTYNGNGVYAKHNGKGYIGKAILGFESWYNDQSQGKFELTIYVKTRANGDTIYIASAETLTKPGMTGGTLHNYLISPTYQPAHGDKPGKSPDAYVRTFQEALSSRTYEEGDVIAILDKVTITGSENTTISGLDFAAIPVIRYDGHHNLWPGEAGVYRGTMIEVDGPGAILTARNIAFDGGCVSKINFNDNATHNYTYDSDPQYIRVDDKGTASLYDDFYADTNQVYGPIISVKNGGTMALGHGSTVMHNWNVTTDDALKGAVHVTSNGVLKIWNNLSIAENFSSTLAGADKIKPLNGALYVDGGILQVASSNKDTKMDLTKSYLMPESPDKWWAVYPDAPASPTRYKVNMDVVEDVASSWTKANVFLTRTAGTTDAVMDDEQSDVINLTAPMTADSRISVSKWFPGEETRDTIRIVNYSDPTYLQSAYTNANFESDVNWNVFYHTWVSSFNIYLHRCATFRQQEITNPATVLLHTTAGGDVVTDKALEYVINEAATCPTGGEQLIYRVKGGFFPYLYEWSGAQSRTHNTVRYNKQVRDDIAKGLDSSFRRAIADTLVTVHAGMSHTEDVKLMTYNVSATDLAGCTVSKTAKITLQKVADTPTPWQVTGTATNWTDTVSGLTATGTRQFKAIQITPYVRADRSSGIVTAIVGGADNDYVFLQEGEEHHDFQGYYFCEGDQLQLGTAPIAGQHFIMWDFDPYYSNPVTYIVPAESRDIIAYYGPSTYWYQTINTTAKAGAVYDEDNYYDARPTPTTAYASTDGSAKAGYVTTYNGDVHIYDENGLAWFISVVNGLNGTQARPFYFNRVFLHKKSNSTDYDMKAHLWSPVGTQQHRFRGDFIGVSADETATTALTDDTVVIRNIIVDEPELANAGFFGFLDSAHVVRVKLESALVRGMQNVGAFAAQSTQSTFEDCSVAGHTEGAGDGTTTILTTHHTSGGFVARSENDAITNSHARAKYVGDAVYSGGILGYSENGTYTGNGTSVTNTSVRNDNRMEGLYIGGLAGYLQGNAPVQSKSNGTAVLANNYVYLNVNGKSQRVGGLVGYAANSLVENNYVHGTIYGTATEGGVGAVLDNGSMSDHNYYESSAVGQTVGQLRGNAIVNDNSNFSGQGNQVQLGTATYGVNNLTRVLNLWVRQHGDNYRTWRSDLENANYGYPIYGEPDMIPVHDEFTYEGCDSIEWDGLLYNESVVLSSHVIDSLLMIDSTSTLHLVVHHSVSEQYADTTTLGQDYAGYGFNVSAAELDLLRLSVNTFGSATIVLSDTLTTATGCDSVINLSLTVTKDLGVVNAEPTDIKVYPNPTTARVTIETEGLSHVELFDNEGRRLQDYTARNAHEITIDVSSFATGAYYLRIHRGNDVTIQKLIKK